MSDTRVTNPPTNFSCRALINSNRILINSSVTPISLLVIFSLVLRCKNVLQASERQAKIFSSLIFTSSTVHGFLIFLRNSLTFNTLWANSAGEKLLFFFFFFPRKKDMKCQILFPGKNKKNISKCHLLKILPRVLSVKKNRKEGNDQDSIQLSHTSHQRRQRERNTNTK